MRPSDHQEPKKIAWLQCVGSRDIKIPPLLLVGVLHVRHQRGGHRQGARKIPLDTAIFFMDMRTFGKNFEQYYNRAREQGVRFIRSRIHSIEPAPGDDLKINYLDEKGQKKNEDFDMVVLSVGMEGATPPGAWPRP